MSEIGPNASDPERVSEEYPGREVLGYSVSEAELIAAWARTRERRDRDIEQVFGGVSGAQRIEMAELILGEPISKARHRQFALFAIALIAVSFLFALMAVWLIFTRHSSEAPLVLAGTALGGAVGLMASQSPGRWSR
ncbi:hypothetical protein ABZ379_37060 [Streptomyces canus]|uniref:hypothetical protein n=1 Tax=Streptomyces canus TaxID=58343 RepID=UPI0033DF2CF6